MAKLKKGSTIDNSLIAVANGSLQEKLNSEMVGGKKAEDLAPSAHNHHTDYYTKPEMNVSLNSKIDKSSLPIIGSAASKNVGLNSGDVPSIGLDGKTDISIMPIHDHNTQYYGKGDVDTKLDEKVDKKDIPVIGTAASKDFGTKAGEVPTLESDGKLSASVIPKIGTTDLFLLDSESKMLSTGAKPGDICIRRDINQTYILYGKDPSQLSNWQNILTPSGSMSSVNGQTGAVILTYKDVEASPEGHMHDDRYHLRSEIADILNSYTSLLALDEKIAQYDSDNDGIVDKADVAYEVAWPHVTHTPENYPPSLHDHNDVYYEKGEVMELVEQRSLRSHTHHGLYIETEGFYEALRGKANSWHSHPADQITELPEVAVTGSYVDLIDLPDFSTVALTGNYADLGGTPELSTIATSGKYLDLIGTPKLSSVATTGNYSDIKGAPQLSSVATSGRYSDIKEAPQLSAVAISGKYSDIEGLPFIPTKITDLEGGVASGSSVSKFTTSINSETVKSGDAGEVGMQFYNIDHGLNSADVVVQCRQDASPYEVINATIGIESKSRVKVTLPKDVAAKGVSVTIIG